MHPAAAKPFQVAIPIIISLGGLASTLLIAHLLDRGTVGLLQISENRMVNLTFTMQIMIFAVSLVALAMAFFYDKKSFQMFFRWGIETSGDKSGWNLYGPLAAVGFTLGTSMMMSFSVMSQHGVINNSFFSLVPLVLLFAATNAWSEEIFTRFVIVAGLHGKISSTAICWTSGIMFGLAHFYGTPSGLFGVVASGFLGGILARSVVDTKGLGWAWLIHFLQDIVIFGAGAMIIAGQS